MAGIYVHIPFCSSFCTYCDFYSITQRGKMEKYVEALIREAESRKDYFADCKSTPTTIYIGGGTPSLLPQSLLKRVVEAIKENFFVLLRSFPEEFTIEVNPDDITSDYAVFLRSLGVNRVSMGVQSFDDVHLKWMNRRHSSEQAVEAFKTLRLAGFDNISLDLIFGYSPEEAPNYDTIMTSWQNDVCQMIELRPEHISAYQMSIEPGSRLATMQYNEPEEEFCAEEYDFLQMSLADAGYLRYEISNFALNGCQSKHNSSYWEREPYIGLGAAAHSFKGRNRSWNIDDVERYVAVREQSAGGEELSDEDVFQETLMLGLRRASGVSLRLLKSFKGLGENLDETISELIGRGLIIKERDVIRIPSDKVFISDYIISLF